MTIFAELRAAANKASVNGNSEMVVTCDRLVIDIGNAIRQFGETPTDDTLRILIAQWTQARVLLERYWNGPFDPPKPKRVA